MRRFFSRIFSFSPTFEQGLITRLLDANQALLDRLLEREGIEPVTERKEEKARVAPVMPPTAFPAEYEQWVDGLAVEAASDEDLMAQAEHNAQYSQEWRDVVARAESKMQPTY